VKRPPKAPAVAAVTGGKPAPPAGYAAAGVGCATPSTALFGKAGTRVALTAKLEHYTARLTGTVLPPAVDFGIVHPMVTVTLPDGKKSSRALSFLYRDTLLPMSIVTGRTSSQMCLVRFAGTSAPTVLLLAGYGGAQARMAALGVPLAPAGIGAPLPLSEMVSGASIVRAGGHPVLLADDARFAGFEGWAAHVDPPIVLSVVGGRFADVTATDPSLVVPTIRSLWQAWARNERQYYGASILTAWTATECEIGHRAAARAELASLAAAGALDWPKGLPIPSGAAWVRSTEATLAAFGYCHG
jgi:hypothetical protein